jgi:nitroreductase
MTATDLGTALPLPTPSPEWLDRLASRRSAPAQALTDPGPTPDQIETILTLGARTPDHGKLAPWRFVVLGRQTRRDLAERLRPLAAHQSDPTKAEKVLTKLTAAPTTLLVVSAPVPGHKVPVWEQELSAGAVCMNLVHALSALGFAASWITDWYAYDPAAAALFDIAPGERIAGFIHIGTLAEPPLERARPDLAAITRHRP